MEYDLATDWYPDSLVKRVNACIADGFEPLGGIAISGTGQLYQAMVKRERPEATSGMVDVDPHNTTWRRIGDTMGTGNKTVEELPKVVRG